MKTYKELTAEQQAGAVARCLNDLLEAVIEGGIRFDDKANGNDLQARIDAAGVAAEKMQTPWFVGEYIMDTCREDLTEMATADAEEILYAGPEDPRVIRGVL